MKEENNAKVLMTSDQYVVQELLEKKQELQLAKKELEEAKDEVDIYKSHYKVLLGLCKIIADNLEEEPSNYGKGLVSVSLDGAYIGNFWEKDLDKQEEEDLTVRTIVKLARLVKAIPQREE